jgi:threonine dehydrogenase-like Zn-dependent dehydrogenase
MGKESLMKAARYHEKGKIVIEDVPLPKLGPKEVLIQVHRAGICGSDVGILQGHSPAKFPITGGHEFSGVIAKLGSPSVGGWKEGERVIASGGWGCGSCELCQTGMGTFCKNRTSLGRNADGCFAEFVKVDYWAVHRLPANVSLDEAQNLLNIACVLRGFKRIPLQIGKTVVVFGPGNMGLIMLQLLKLAGAYRAIMVGTRDFRLEMAKTFGADHVVNVRREDPVKTILGWYPEGVDVVVEATGSGASFQSCCDVVKARGSIVSVGIFSDKAKELDLSFLYQKEPVIYGSKGGDGCHEEAIQLLEEKRLQITPMITHRFPLEETAEAFKTFENKVENAMRIVIEPCA